MFDIALVPNGIALVRLFTRYILTSDKREASFTFVLWFRIRIVAAAFGILLAVVDCRMCIII